MANVLLRRELHKSANSAATTSSLLLQLQPSSAIEKASPKIASILASYGDDHDIAPPPRPASISQDEWNEWHTPNMPVLTPRQLELSILEIRRRQQHRRPQGTSEQASSQSTATTAANTDAKRKQAAVLVPLCTVQGTPSVLFTRRSAQLSSHASQISFPGGYYDEALDAEEGSEWKDRLVRTALREMHEELQYDINRLGLDDDDRSSSYGSPKNNGEDASSDLQRRDGRRKKPPLVTIAGRTRPVPSLTGSKVTPIIGTINYDLPRCDSLEFKTLFPGNRDEVDWIFAVPIIDLMNTETSEPLKRWSTSYGDETDNADGTEKKSSEAEPWGPVFPVPECDEMRKEGDKIWGLTAIVLRPLLKRVFGPVFGGKDGLGLVNARREDHDDIIASKL